MGKVTIKVQKNLKNLPKISNVDLDTNLEAPIFLILQDAKDGNHLYWYEHSKKIYTGWGCHYSNPHLGNLHMESSAPMKHYINTDFCSALYCFPSRSRHPLLFSLQVKLLVEVCYVVWLWYSLLLNYKNTFLFRASTLALGKPSPWEHSCNICTGNPSPSKL